MILVGTFQLKIFSDSVEPAPLCAHREFLELLFFTPDYQH